MDWLESATVGMNRRDEPWMDVAADVAESGTGCWSDYPNKTGGTATASACYSGGSDGGPSVPDALTTELCTNI